jgi:hypothetical protein
MNELSMARFPSWLMDLSGCFVRLVQNWSVRATPEWHPLQMVRFVRSVSFNIETK